MEQYIISVVVYNLDNNAYALKPHLSWQVVCERGCDCRDQEISTWAAEFIVSFWVNLKQCNASCKIFLVS